VVRGKSGKRRQFQQTKGLMIFERLKTVGEKREGARKKETLPGNKKKVGEKAKCLLEA